MKIDQTKLNGISNLLLTAVLASQNVLAQAVKPESDGAYLGGGAAIGELLSILDDRKLVEAINSVMVKEEIPSSKTWANSTQIDKTSWDGMTMTVVFKTGATYEYYNVPESAWIVMLNAESVGKTLNATIKGNYEFAKV